MWAIFPCAGTCDGHSARAQGTPLLQAHPPSSGNSRWSISLQVGPIPPPIVSNSLSKKCESSLLVPLTGH